ncbi:hypothetical protein DFH08DRAFT_631297, partial [Mycena albidolilacea]
RTLKFFKMLGVLNEVLKVAHKPVEFQNYELPGGVKPIKTWAMSPTLEPTPARPFVRCSLPIILIGRLNPHHGCCQPNAIFLNQDQVEGIVRERLKEFGCLADLGAELLGFDQSEEHVSAELSTKTGSTEINVKYLIGADGAKGIVRKELGLAFLGEA